MHTDLSVELLKISIHSIMFQLLMNGKQYNYSFCGYPSLEKACKNKLTGRVAFRHKAKNIIRCTEAVEYSHNFISDHCLSKKCWKKFRSTTSKRFPAKTPNNAQTKSN